MSMEQSIVVAHVKLHVLHLLSSKLRTALAKDNESLQKSVTRIDFNDLLVLYHNELWPIVIQVHPVIAGNRQLAQR